MRFNDISQDVCLEIALH